jgi:4-alpha-glucanotransferase
VNLEDLWGEEKPQNIPGTTCEYSNWRLKAAWPIEKIKAAKTLKDFLKELSRRRRLAKHEGNT